MCVCVRVHMCVCACVCVYSVCACVCVLFNESDDVIPIALTADELLPILVYLVIISDIPNWHGNMAYINNFHFSRIGIEEFA